LFSFSANQLSFKVAYVVLYQKQKNLYLINW